MAERAQRRSMAARERSERQFRSGIPGRRDEVGDLLGARLSWGSWEGWRGSPGGIQPYRCDRVEQEMPDSSLEITHVWRPIQASAERVIDALRERNA